MPIGKLNLSTLENPGRGILYRCDVTPTLLQYLSTGHWLHIGEIGRQTFWPNVTSRSLYSIQYCRGNFFLKATSVSLGFFVRTYPHRLEILWTWVSTQIPGLQ